MAHDATEAFAIQPHNNESARVDSLVPDQLRSTSKNLIGLLKEYYDYMNIDGITNVVNILQPGTGTQLGYNDIVASDATIGMDVKSFVPSSYNQKYVKISDEDPSFLNYAAQFRGATTIYRGLTDSTKMIMRTDNSVEGDLKNTWVMVTDLNGQLYLDFYDSNYNQGDVGSNTDDPEKIIWAANPGRSFTSAVGEGSAGAFIIGTINAIAISQNISDPTTSEETSIINFTDIPTSGGHGKGLTLDITVDTGKVTIVRPNQPGYGYWIDDIIYTDVLNFALYTVGDVIAGPSNVVDRILAEHDIDKTTDDYLGRIQKEIAKGIPDAVNLDKGALYKKITEYYATRGSEHSAESFFKIFFDEIASISYPKELLLKPSDGDYQGTSAVSPTKEKYYYKNGWDGGRRIAFYKDNRHMNIRQATYFVDFEFGEDFKKGVTDATAVGQQANAIALTPLFAGTETDRAEFTHLSGRDATVHVQIDSSNNLIIGGRFGSYQSDFTKTYTSYVTGVGDFPFQEPANASKQRVKLALTVDIREIDSYKNASNSPNQSLGHDHNSPTYHLGSVSIAISNSGVSNNSPTAGTVSTTLGLGRSTKDISLYPSAIGSGFIPGNLGEFENYRQNPFGEIRFYTFAFLDSAATDLQVKNFVNSGSIPATCLVDIDFDNNGSSNFTNKGSTVILATQIKFTEDGLDGVSPMINPQATNYGLSSTGSEYPRRISWKGVKGFLSNAMKLHDGDYFQEFSYLIRTQLSVSNWETEFSKLIHPAGMKFFTALLLELAAIKENLPTKQPPNLAKSGDGVTLYQWLYELNNQPDVVNGMHSPKWQPGFFDFISSAYIEIILYEAYSAFYETKQSEFNQREDKFWNDDSGLNIKQQNVLTSRINNSPNANLNESILPIAKGNAKRFIYDSTKQNGNDISSKSIGLTGKTTGVITDFKVEDGSSISLDFSLPNETYKNNIGKYIAGSEWVGTDGHKRKISVKQIEKDSGGNHRVEVEVSDFGASVSDSTITSIKVVGQQNDYKHGGQGVYFSDSNLTNHTSGSRGHTVVVLNPTTGVIDSTTTYDTYGSGTTNIVSDLGGHTAGRIICIYTKDASTCDQALRDRLHSDYGAGDQTTIWSNARTSHVFIGVKGGSNGTAIERVQHHVGNQGSITGVHTATFSSATNKHNMNIPIVTAHYNTSGELSHGPFLQSQPTQNSLPLKVNLNTTTGENKKLTINTNGEIKLDNTILRTELEASDPTYVKEIKLDSFDWSDRIKDINTIRNDTALSNNNNSGGYYYDERLGGIVFNGGARWLSIENRTEIEPDAEYEISITIKNLIPDGAQKVYAGVLTRNSGGSVVSTDKLTSYNYGLASGQILSANQERTFTRTFSGFNPPVAAGVSQAGLSSGKFDPGGTQFDLIFIVNYASGNQLTNESNHPNVSGQSRTTTISAAQAATLIKNITIKRKDGKAVRDSAIKKWYPYYGIKKITSSALPLLDSPSNENAVLRNTFALGTINQNKKLAGVHALNDSPTYDSNILKDHPWVSGEGDQLTGTFEGRGDWDAHGTTAENSREVRVGPFGYKEIVWVGTNKDNAANKEDGGWFSPVVDASANNNYKFSMYFKHNGDDDISGGRLGYFGLNTLASNGGINTLGLSSVANGNIWERSYSENTLPNTNAVGSFISFIDTGPMTKIKISIGGNKFYNRDAVWFDGVQFENSTALEHMPKSHRYYLSDKADEGNGEYSFILNTNQMATTRLNTAAFGQPIINNTAKIYRIGHNNHYFRSWHANSTNTSGNNLASGKWYLAVGYLYGLNAQAGKKSTNPFGFERPYKDAGIYDVETGEKLQTASDFQILTSDISALKIRAFQHRCNKIGLSTEWARPRIDIADGREPSNEDLLRDFAIGKANFNSSVNLTEFYGSNTNQSVRHLFTEAKGSGVSLTPITSIPASETSTSSAEPAITGGKTLLPAIKDVLGGSAATIVTRTAISKIIPSSDHTQSKYLALDNKRFSVKQSQFTTTGNGTGAEFEFRFLGGHPHITIINGGKGYAFNDTITVSDSLIGNTGAPDLTFKIAEVGPGRVRTINDEADVAHDKLYLVRDVEYSDNDQITPGYNGEHTTTDFNWEKYCEYEITFNAKKIYDNNIPANLFISGGNKIGFYKNLVNHRNFLYSMGNPITTPLLNSRYHGTGPIEFSFESSVEGTCRILIAMDDAESGIRLAHNGHQLRVDDTNSKSISRARVPIKWYDSSSTEIQAFTAPDMNSRIFEDFETGIDGDALDDIDFLYSTYCLESEYLCYGSNTIQIFTTQPDGANPAFIKVIPASNGLITEGANTHRIYMGAGVSDPKICIDHVIDRDSQRTELSSAAGRNAAMLRDAKLKSFNWEIEDVVVRKLRPIPYYGRYQAIVADPPDPQNYAAIDVNAHPDFGTAAYRPVDVTSVAATDGAIGFGGELSVPATQAFDSDTDLGQPTFTRSGVQVNTLGIPKGKYGALKFSANNVNLHYIDIGSSTERFPTSLFKPNTQYTVTGKVFIPTGNTKLQNVSLFAGINPRELDTNGQPKVNASGHFVFKNPIGKHQARSGRLVGYGAYDIFPTTITTKGVWVDFEHLFYTPTENQDARPVLRFVGTLKDEKILKRISPDSPHMWVQTPAFHNTPKGSGDTPHAAIGSVFAFNSPTSGIMFEDTPGEDAFTAAKATPITSATANTPAGYPQLSNYSPDISGYSGDATGEAFYIKDICIKEGVNPKEFLEKKYINERHEAIVNIADKVRYDIDLDSPSLNQDAFAAVDLRFGNTTNQYTIKHSDNILLDTFTLEDLDTIDSNLLASSLPFPTNNSPKANFQTFYGQNNQTSNTPTNLINSPNGYIPLGNPLKLGIGTQNSPYTTTFENLGELDFNPFGGRDIIWEARNTDAAWRVINRAYRKSGASGKGSGFVNGTYTNVPLIDYSNKAVGTGAKATIVVTGGGISTVTITDGGFNYGRGQTSLANIPLTFAIGPKYNTGTRLFAGAAGAATYINRTDLGNSPDSPNHAFYGLKDGVFTAANFNSPNATIRGSITSSVGANSPLTTSTNYSYNDGGFKSPIVEVDPTKDYRFSVWVKQSDTRYGVGNDSPSNSPSTLNDGGRKIIRWQAMNESNVVQEVNNITKEGNTATAPQFINDFDLGVHQTNGLSDTPKSYTWHTAKNKYYGGATKGLNNNKWFLIVGHIRAYDSDISANHANTGVFIPSPDARKIRTLDGDNRGDWKMTATTKKVQFTCLHSANPRAAEDSVYFYGPRIDEITGLEPTIEELTSGNIGYKIKSNQTSKEIPIINWSNPISNSNRKISDYKHAILGDDFSVQIKADKVKDGVVTKEYANIAASKFKTSNGATDTIITLEVPPLHTSWPIILPLQNAVGSAQFGCDVDWGDGTSNYIRFAADKDLYHTYTQASSSSVTPYTITIRGNFDRFNVAATNSASASTVSSTLKSKARANFKQSIRTFYLGNTILKKPSSGDTLSFKNCFSNSPSDAGLTTFTSVDGVSNTSNITNMSQMFQGAKHLTTADISGFDTSNVTSMSQMFEVGTSGTPKTGLTIKGLHTRNISNLSRGTGGGLDNFAQYTTFNSDELARCYQAWGNQTFTPTPSLGRTGASASGTSAPAVTAKINQMTARTLGTTNSGNNRVYLNAAHAEHLKQGETQSISDLRVGAIVQSSNAAFPTTGAPIKIGAIGSNYIDLVQSDGSTPAPVTSNMGGTTLLRFPVCTGDTVIPIDTLTGHAGNSTASIISGSTVSHGDSDFGTTTITSIGTRTITLAAAIGGTNGTVTNNTNCTFTSKTLKLSSAPTGTILGGHTVTGVGSGARVISVTDSTTIELNSLVAQDGGAVTFAFSDGDRFDANFGNTKYKPGASKDSPSDDVTNLADTSKTLLASDSPDFGWTITDGGIDS